MWFCMGHGPDSVPGIIIHTGSEVTGDGKDPFAASDLEQLLIVGLVL